MSRFKVDHNDQKIEEDSYEVSNNEQCRPKLVGSKRTSSKLFAESFNDDDKLKSGSNTDTNEDMIIQVLN